MTNFIYISSVLYFRLYYHLPKEYFGDNGTDMFEIQMYIVHIYITFK